MTIIPSQTKLLVSLNLSIYISEFKKLDLQLQYWEGLGAGARELKAACRASLWLCASRYSENSANVGDSTVTLPCKDTLAQRGGVQGLLSQEYIC